MSGIFANSTFEDVIIRDDLTVSDAATITGDLTVGGNIIGNSGNLAISAAADLHYTPGSGGQHEFYDEGGTLCWSIDTNGALRANGSGNALVLANNIAMAFRDTGGSSDNYCLYGDSGNNTCITSKTGENIELETNFVNKIVFTGTEKIPNFVNTMGDSTVDPSATAPTDWVEIQISGTTYYLPAYPAS